MKSLLILIASLMTVSIASANPANFPSDFPKDWALAMASAACDVEVTEDMYGKTKKSGKARYYTIYDGSGQVVAKSWASNQWVWAKKVCLSN